MKILVLGGSWFVGRHLVESAVSHGHDVTVFNRGRTPATYPDGVHVLHGDRTSPADLDGLAAGARSRGGWDAVVDVPEMHPDVVGAAARSLQSVTGRYAFISTVSVYAGWPNEPGPFTEDSPLHVWEPDAVGSDGVAAYGPSKVGGEDAVGSIYGAARTLVIRPGVVIGPGEYVGRIPWWLARAARAVEAADGGRILAPGRPERIIQPVDVRDLADVTIRLLTDDSSGPWNVAAPTTGSGGSTFGDLIAAALAAADPSPLGGDLPDVVWADEDWLVDHGVRQWTELPLWRTAPGTWNLDSTKARDAGLMTRPLASTVADVHAWLNAGGRPVDHERWHEHGIDAAREADLLHRWDHRHPGPAAPAEP